MTCDYPVVILYCIPGTLSYCNYKLYIFTALFVAKLVISLLLFFVLIVFVLIVTLPDVSCLVNKAFQIDELLQLRRALPDCAE